GVEALFKNGLPPDIFGRPPIAANDNYLTWPFIPSRRERKKVEMRFAHMKRILRLDRFRLRGLSGVRDEVLLTATAQNLGRLAKLLYRAPPLLAAPCPA
ncbi:MAG TPA: transposase, partial [Xanthobacteraceae bacterium]